MVWLLEGPYPILKMVFIDSIPFRFLCSYPQAKLAKSMGLLLFSVPAFLHPDFFIFYPGCPIYIFFFG